MTDETSLLLPLAVPILREILFQELARMAFLHLRRIFGRALALSQGHRRSRLALQEMKIGLKQRQQWQPVSG